MTELERKERNLQKAKHILAMANTEGWRVVAEVVRDAIEKNRDRLESMTLDPHATAALRVEIGFKRWLLRFVEKATPESIKDEEERLAPLREREQQRQDSGLP